METIVVKIFALIKAVVFVFVYILFGIKYSKFSSYFDKHTEEIIGGTTGTVVGLMAIPNSPDAVTLKGYMIGLAMIAGKTLTASSVAFFATFILKRKFKEK